MAEFTISGRMKVKTVKANFKDAFGVGLRIYKGKKFADDEATISSLREKTGSDDLKIHGNMLVKSVEENINNIFGITVQVENKQGELADNNVTISSLLK